MNKDINGIFAEYEKGRQVKSAIGAKGMYEQSSLNARFFSGDQWSGAAYGGDRPLVRHNVIKRIGEYKLSQILADKISVKYTAEGIPDAVGSREGLKELKAQLANDPDYKFSGPICEKEINVTLSCLSDYRKGCADRLVFDGICADALRDAYINGGSVVYTYWDTSTEKGDIGCEVLSINDVYFGDVYTHSVEDQPYIIIAANSDVNFVLREAAQFGADALTKKRISESATDGKVLVLTKLYKEYGKNGKATVHCVKVTENAVVRKPFDTGLSLYPVALFNFNERTDIIYGESEITHLIPNQIAINRLITASVWSGMSMGMPIMVVNGDTVTCDVTNDPGQIVKVYGTNEDCKGAISYVTPPDCTRDFAAGIQTLINDTLSQSGATPVVLGEERSDNATAIMALRDSAITTLNLTKRRYYIFVEQIAKIWADFFIKAYGNRKIRIEDENGVWYFPFDAERYKDLILSAGTSVVPSNKFSEKECFDMLLSLFEKGVIDKNELIKRIPDEVLPQKAELLKSGDEEEKE